MDRLRNAQERLNTMRSRVDFSPYIPVSDAPRWLCDLAKIAKEDLGVLALLGPAGISIATGQGQPVRVKPDPAGVFLAGLASHICATGRRLAIGIPPAGRHLMLLLASTAILANAIKRSLTSTALTEGCILVISPDLDVRSRYCDLFVDREVLDKVYVGSRMRSTGERVTLRGGNIYKSQGVCFFLPGLSLPEKIKFKPVLVLLDLRYSRWVNRASDLTAWVTKMCKGAGVLALYTIDDKDTVSALCNAGFSDIPLDHAAITTCFEQVVKPYVPQRRLAVDWQMEGVPAFLEREHEVIEVKLVESVKTLFTDIGRLVEDLKERDAPDIRRARWILATLAHLPVPIIWYEQAALSLGRSTLRSLITKLGVHERYNSDLGAVIQTLRMQFEQLYQNLSQINLRAETLQTLLPQIVAPIPNEQVLLLVRDRVTERAVQRWLELEIFPEADWLSRVTVQGFPSYYNLAAQRYAVVLVNGVFPYRYRWIAGAPLGPHVKFLAYTQEVEVIERQLQHFYGDSICAERERQRDRTISQLTLRVTCSTTDEKITRPRLRLKLPPQESTKDKMSQTEVTIRDITKLSEVMKQSQRATERKFQEELIMGKLASWGEEASDEEPPEEDSQQVIADQHEEAVACIRLHVHSRAFGECEIWLATDDITDFVRPSRPNDIQRATPQQLQAKDVLLLMNEGRRVNLFDRFVELAEDQPETRYLATYRRTWREAIQRIVARHQNQGHPDYAAILQSLQEAGATIQSEPAVRYWVQDQVIGPDNVASIIAVGRVSGMDSLVHQAKEFDRVFRSIRGIRQKIGRRLNSTIRRHFKQFIDEALEVPEDSLDNHIGIPLEELIDTIDLVEVISVGAHIERVIPRYVGRLRPIK